MFFRRKTSEISSGDPLVDRARKRFEYEHKRDDHREAIWRGMRSQGISGIVVVVIVWFVGAVIVATFEEIRSGFSNRKAARRKRSNRKSRVRVHIREV